MKTIVCKNFMTMMVMLVLTAFSAWTADAEEPKDKQSVEDLVVTATRTAGRPIDVPVETQVITQDQIQMSGAMDIGDLIGKYVTGHYHKYSGLLSPIGMRGVRTDGHGEDIKGPALILIDGHRIGTGNAAKIALDRIERVEVTKGAASALYGSAALGGVINLITKKGDGDLSATLSADYGSFDYYKGQISGGGSVSGINFWKKRCVCGPIWARVLNRPRQTSSPPTMSTATAPTTWEIRTSSLRPAWAMKWDTT